MSMINRSQGSIFSIAGKALSSPNSILKAKSPFTKNQQQVDYKLDIDVKGDTVKDKLFRKRVQLLEESAKNPNILKETGMGDLLTSSKNDTPLLKNRSDDVSALIDLIKKNKDAIDDAYFKKDTVDANGIAFINSDGEQIKNVANNGQQNVQDAIVNPLIIGNNDLSVTQLSKPATVGASIPDPKLNQDITGDIISRLEGKNNFEKYIITDINNTFTELARKLSEYKNIEQNGGLGLGAASSNLNLGLSWIAKDINGYNENYNDPSFFDTVIDSLQAAKKSLFTDPEVTNDAKKMSVVGTSTLIDYITDMFKRGKEGTALSEGNYWDDAYNILSSEFGGDNGGSLITVDDKSLSWKYEEYKKRLTAELDNKSHLNNYDVLISDLQTTKENNNSSGYLKNLTEMLYQ
ncbi:hypothetical protein [Pectinatus cerevisiiphilus]|uniref:Uncharacterized protein n=1 Tax=Pectinatus cerevisiiphilus TaxID=86956 RepID=A0A4V2USN1_9FIRM|nr:hypothetical protein [Pectinatus cerevisiiphilus]TCS82062.1 hypothetical protein EDC37_101235 [Pectinatus cerevisiiphilus]